MDCKNYEDLDYINQAAEDTIEKLKQQSFSIAGAALENLTGMLKIFLRDITDKATVLQMNQKLEHMMQVVDDSLQCANKQGHYAKSSTTMNSSEKELCILNGILHDAGRIFEIYCLGTSGAKIDFNHSVLGGKFLGRPANTSLLDNSGKELPVEAIDEFLVSNLQNAIREDIKPEDLQKLSRLKLMCLPYNVNRLHTGTEYTAEQVIIYCVTHHGDKDIPVNCPESMVPYLSNIRVTDRIANLHQGMFIDPALITGGKTAEQIATTYQPVDLDENGNCRDDAFVIDDLTYAELTTGAKAEDGLVYFGVDRGRKKDDEGRAVAYTPMRMFLSRVGWLYADDNDLSFYNYCNTSNCIGEYCDKVKPFLKEADRQRMEEIEKFAKSYVNQRISELSPRRMPENPDDPSK